MKKKLSLLIVLMIVLVLPFQSFATNDKEDETIIIDTTYINDYAEENEFSTRSVNPGYGAVKIEDTLGGTSAWVNVANESFNTYEASKYVLIKIIKNVPIVGDVYSRGEDIYNDLKAVHSYMTDINYLGQTEYVTKYSTRPFSHDLYVWGYNDTWEDRGYSLSKYFYKSTAMFYIDNDGEAQSGTVNYNYSNGYEPEEIAEASHYMNKPYLAERANYYWKYNIGRYVETY